MLGRVCELSRSRQRLNGVPEVGDEILNVESRIVLISCFNVR